MPKGKRSKGSLRAKAGLPAKAGRRKTYGPIVKNKDGVIITGKRKTKDWSHIGSGYCMASLLPGGTTPIDVRSNANGNTGRYNNAKLTERELERRKQAVAAWHMGGSEDER